MPTKEAPALAIWGLSKSFAGSVALSDFRLRVQPGQVHVLIGQNGSGKSTLIKILSGYHQPDPGGEVRVGDEPLTFGSGDRAYRLGCRFVHQDLGLVLSSSVLDNLSLGAGYPTRLATIRKRAAFASARATLRRVGLDLDPATTVADLPAAQRTGVAIARAMRADPLHPARVLVLDEPTATLPTDEVDHLLGILRTAAGNGVAILYVTHHLDEVFRIADHVTVLRDAVRVFSSPITDVDRDTLVEQLVGDAVDVPRRTGGDGAHVARTAGAGALVVTAVSCGVIRDISLSVGVGEIVGIAGLTGSGSDTVLGAIFGALPRDAGHVLVNGRQLPSGRPDLAIAAGVGYLPGDRKVQGGIMGLSARENLTLNNLRPFWSRWRLSRRMELAETRSWFAKLHVHPVDAPQQLLERFSGGNQQKILFAKWLRCQLVAFLLDEPTQGVDVGAKVALHRQLLEVAAQGTAVVLSSTDIDELAVLCDRVLVFRDGRIVHELGGDQVQPAAITRALMSHKHPIKHEHPDQGDAL